MTVYIRNNNFPRGKIKRGQPAERNFEESPIMRCGKSSAETVG